MDVGYETLAVYKDISDNPPAIISLKLGLGNVLLSGTSKNNIESCCKNLN
jgi:glutamine amidotransferase-like uncharacterized protein